MLAISTTKTGHAQTATAKSPTTTTAVMDLMTSSGRITAIAAIRNWVLPHRILAHEHSTIMSARIKFIPHLNIGLLTPTAIGLVICIRTYVQKLRCIVRISLAVYTAGLNLCP